MILAMQLDDTIIRTIEISPDEELKESRDLILRIRRRNLYQVETCFLIPFWFLSINHMLINGLRVAVL